MEYKDDFNFEQTPRSEMGSFEAPLSVGDLTDLIKRTIETKFFEVVIEGEVSNFKAHTSGHFYFSLKDDRAMITAVMFRGDNSKIKFKVQDGLKVVAVGKLSVYPPRGNYQIVISRMEPAGVGALQLAFEQLKKKLQAKGYFDADRKRPIPLLPRKLGIVTSPTGAAIRDMLNVLNRRFAGVHVLICPVRVQGEGSAQEVAEGIRYFNSFFPDVEVLIVGRGGGSIEDLWAFNEEVVADAIFKSKIPVISAVGHEVDFTIADFVADLRAPTPSAAAELVIANKIEIIHRVDQWVKRLLQVRSRLEMTWMRVDDFVQRLERSLSDKLSEVSFTLETLRSKLWRHSPQARLQGYIQRAIAQFDLLRRLPRGWIEKNQIQIKHFEDKLRLLNPRAIMERGYSIVRVLPSQKVVKKASDVQMGDKLLIELSKGKITAGVR